MGKHTRNSAPHATNAPSTRIITQQMLRDFQEAGQRAALANRRLAKIEKKLIELLDAETPLERGSLSAHVQGYLSYDLDLRDIRNYLSELDYVAFRSSLSLKSHKELVVEDQDEGIEVESDDPPPHKWLSRSAVAGKNHKSREDQ
jgi:hypothetical protein